MRQPSSRSNATTRNVSINTCHEVNQEVTQKVNHEGHPTAANTLHFSVFKKLNTFYLRVLHYTGSPNRKSVTVSLRTNHRYRAVGNADYLKQRLVEGIGMYRDFEDIRVTSKSIARTELVSEKKKYSWFKEKTSHSRGTKPSTLAYDAIVQQPQPKQPPAHKPTTKPAESLASCNLISLIQLFIEDKVSSRSWKPSTEYCRKASFTTLEKFIRKLGMHSKPLGEIKRSDLISIRQSMLNDGFKNSTVNLRMGDFISLFEFAEINELIEKSPALKLKIRETTTISKKESAKSIKPEIIPDLLRHITEFASTRRVQKLHTPYLPWIAQLAAITGCRIAELAQLRKADVKQTDAGNWYISIHEKIEGNSVKNSSSIRDVPLIDGAYGFDLNRFISDVVSTLDNNMGYLFRTSGKARNSLSNWFSLAMKKYRGKQSSLFSFHSFRHSLSTLCLNKGMPEAFAKLVLGHAGGSITYGLYGAAGVSIDTLHNEMASKVFDCS